MLIHNLVSIELTLFFLGFWPHIQTHDGFCWRFVKLGTQISRTYAPDYSNIMAVDDTVSDVFTRLSYTLQIFLAYYSPLAQAKICCGLASQVKLTHPYVSDTQETYSWALYWPSKKMKRKDKRNTLMVLMIGRRAVPAAGAETVDLSLEASLCQVNIILTEMVVEIIVKVI